MEGRALPQWADVLTYELVYDDYEEAYEPQINLNRETYGQWFPGSQLLEKWSSRFSLYQIQISVKRGGDLGFEFQLDRYGLEKSELKKELANVVDYFALDSFYSALQMGLVEDLVGEIELTEKERAFFAGLGTKLLVHTIRQLAEKEKGIEWIVLYARSSRAGGTRYLVESLYPSLGFSVALKDDVYKEKQDDLLAQSHVPMAAKLSDFLSMSKKNICAHCQLPQAKFVCSHCLEAKYCGPSCQRQNQSKHF